MKQLKFLLVLVFATILSVSCNNDDDSNSDATDSALIGSWEYSEVFDGEEFLAVVTFNANNSGTTYTEYTFEGETESETDNFTWSTNGNKLSISDSEGTEVVIYSITGNKLSITDDTNTVTVFTKQ